MTNSELAQMAIKHLTSEKYASAGPSEASRPVSWLRAWREVVALAKGVEDARLPTIIEALTLCDSTFERGDWLAFQRAKEAVRQAVQCP